MERYAPKTRSRNRTGTSSSLRIKRRRTPGDRHRTTQLFPSGFVGRKSSSASLHFERKHSLGWKKPKCYHHSYTTVGSSSQRLPGSSAEERSTRRRKLTSTERTSKHKGLRREDRWEIGTAAWKLEGSPPRG